MPVHVSSTCAHHQDVRIALQSLWYHHTYRCHSKFYFMPLHVSSTCAHHQEVKITIHSLWYHHAYRCKQETTTYSCDDTRGCVLQFSPPDDEHMCSKHVEA